LVSSTNTIGGIPQSVPIFPAKPFGLAGDFVVSPCSHRIQPVLLARPGTHSGSQFGHPFFKFADALFERFRHGNSIVYCLRSFHQELSCHGRAKLGQLAKVAKLNRESLYKLLFKDGNPRLSSLTSILAGLGMELQFVPKAAAA